MVEEGKLNVPPDLDHASIGPEQYDLQHYRFPGPVCEQFFVEDAFVSFIQGPYGSGKTTACFFKLLDRARRMPICKDGRRHYRALVLRDTYRRMERTAIRSWNKWFPQSIGDWKGGQDRPSKHVIVMEDLDGVELVFEVEFAAVGDADVEDFMGGYEITDLYLNEANLQSQDVLTYGAGRCGRFPSMKDLPPGTKFEYGVIGDLNAPDPDSWLLQLQFGDLDEELAHLGKTSFFVQPGGRDPAAENIGNLPEDYYTRLAAANKHQPWWVSRMIDNKPGYSRSGKPVYETYNDQRHCPREPLPLIPSLPLLFGFDAGMHPAGVAGHWLPSGQFRIVAEFVPGWLGPTRFGELIKTWIDQEASGQKLGMAWADPTAYDGADQQGGELSWVEIVQAKTKLRIKPAPSNEPSIRQDAVSQMLAHTIDGTEPGLLLSKSCVALRKGFMSHYRFQKEKTDQGDGFAYKPQKNDASHPHDALQYLVLGARGKSNVVQHNQTAAAVTQRRPTGVVMNTGFSVFG